MSGLNEGDDDDDEKRLIPFLDFIAFSLKSGAPNVITYIIHWCGVRENQQFMVSNPRAIK